MQTVIDVLKKARGYLEGKGVPQAKLDVEHLMADTLNCSRLDLYLQHDRPLDESVLSLMRTQVKRRGEREPLQYILGKAAFMDFTLKVDRRVLIPRPETETLIEAIVDVFSRQPKRVLDLGVGSGAIAIALARAYSQAEVLGVDASEEALELARDNAETCEVGARLELLKSDWFEAVSGSFDLVVSNPPYLTEDEWASAEPEVRDYEPKEALSSPEDGRRDLELIIRGAHGRIHPGGMLALETGIHQHEALTSLAKNVGYASCASKQDLSGRDRFFFAWV